MALNYTDQQHYELAKEFLESPLGIVEFSKLKGICAKTVRRAIKKNRHQIEYDIKDDQRLTGVSKYTSWKDENGQTQAQWVKTDVKHEELIEKLRDFAEGLKEEIPQIDPTPPPKITYKDLLNFYVITDAHIGMRSDEWNLQIAEKVIKGWIEYMIKRTPDAHTGVLCFQGDTSHWDGHEPVTSMSGHVLDAACSTRSMGELVAHLINYAINRMLTKHKHVHVMYIDGNHDRSKPQIGSVWLNLMYANEPRVTIDTNESGYYAYEWGDVSLFSHHGHRRNINDISKVFAGMYRDLFGRTKYSYGHIGHYHHVKRKPLGDDGLMDVQIHPTLAGKDDYAIKGGWLSQRGAKAIMYHKKFGEVDTATGRPEMFL